MSKVKLNIQAPDFSLKDINGEQVTLSSFQGEKNVILVLNRGFI